MLSGVLNFSLASAEIKEIFLTGIIFCDSKSFLKEFNGFMAYIFGATGRKISKTF